MTDPVGNYVTGDMGRVRACDRRSVAGPDRPGPGLLPAGVGTRLGPGCPTALDAVETHLEALRTHWKDDAVPASAAGALFPRRQPNRVYREEPTRQVQLRLQTDAAATLRRVATECQAPSTTALVDQALRRELLDHRHG